MYIEEPEYDDETEEFEAMTTEQTVNAEGIQITVPTQALATIAQCAAARIEAQLSETVSEMVEERLNAILDEAWKASIGKMAQDAIDAYLNKPRPQTNEWGESISGKTTTLSSRIPKAVEEWMAQKVDGKGVPQSDNYRHYETRMQWIIRTLVAEQLEAATKKAADDVTEKARAVVSAQVARFVSEQMVPAIELRQ